MGDYCSKTSLRKRSRSLPETGFKNTNIETFAEKMSARSDEKQFYRSKSFKKSLSTSEIPLLVTPPTPRQGISTVKGLEDIIILKDTQAQERTKMLQPRDRRSTSTLYQYDTSVTMR